MSKIDKLRSRLNEEFRDRLPAAFKEKFDRDLETEFNFMQMALVSRPADGKRFTKQQHDWVSAYSDGYAEAMSQVK